MECGQSIYQGLVPSEGEARVKAIGEAIKAATESYKNSSDKQGWICTSVSHQTDGTILSLIVNFVRVAIS